jgi:uncharacterized repeat protein (TIGR04076 family)
MPLLSHCTAALSCPAGASAPEFSLYDLRVEVIEGDKPFVCSHEPGSAFEVRGENLHFSADKPFSLYTLAALLPLLPAKQRP